VAVAAAVRFTFNVDVVLGTISFTLKDHLAASVPGTLAYASGTFTATFTPTAPLAAGETYTATLAAAQDHAGNGIVAPVGWVFHTVAAAVPYTLWNHATTTPGTVDSGDGAAYTMGMVWKSDAAGNVTKISFYKSTANVGVHIGAIWTDSGTLLGQKTFGGETASGWQTATFDTPIPIAANTHYRAGVLMPSGHYSYDAGYWTAGYTGGGGHLTVPASPTKNGVFNPGGSLAFPDSPGGGNYWVDVEVAI